MNFTYQPPYEITTKIVYLIENIGECLGQVEVNTLSSQAPRLRRNNRIKTIQASLEIEGNTLSLQQVTAVIDGKRVLGKEREIQEVHNTFQAYENFEQWQPHSSKDLLIAHSLLMDLLLDKPGQFRTGSVGIQRGKEVIHIAPPAERVEFLVEDLLTWLKHSPEHPLITSCVAHYELEFIHPFQDGNGRIGRLWQTLILSKWKPVFSLLPVEAMIRTYQDTYYQTLRQADGEGESTIFIEFMLKTILSACEEIIQESNVPTNVPVNVPVNKRQQWFLNQLNQGVLCKPANIVAQWGVVEKTAKRDISDLQKKGLIIFEGPTKTGKYTLTPTS